ncbi:MAG: AAA family ATPase [Candidatus Paceibacterota bacterium]
MRLKNLEINGFKSFAKKTTLEFESPVVAIVGPNGSGKSNVVEAIRFVLGEQSIKSMRGKAGTDLVFKGSKHLSKGSRAQVSIYFDNSDKVFKLSNENGENINLNFDTISISREVYSDGLNKYILNGTEVRLKDINALLASVNVGSSGHHIISQGEADRILNASPKDRREMVEDALGLKIYQYKIRETERKLERSNNNMNEVSLLRRENAPHLNFLKKQVEKFQKAEEMKIDLLSFYHEYLKNESIYLENEKNSLLSEKSKILNELKNIPDSIFIESNNSSLEISDENGNKEELKKLEQKINEIRSAKSEIERKLGRIEGMIEMEEGNTEKVERPQNVSVNREELESFLKEADEYLEEAIYMDVLENIAPLLGKIRDILNRFSRNFEKEKPFIDNSEKLLELRDSQQAILVQMKEIENEENRILESINLLKNKINTEINIEREQEREKFNLKVKHQELSSSLRLISVKEENLSKETEFFENEIREGITLIGHDILSYKDFVIENSIIDKFKQEEIKKKIERIKIKLEDVGAGGGGEIIREFEEVRDRDNFLAKEIEDLTASIESLKTLMVGLKEKIDAEFKEGIKKINTEFQEFFALMFGGGNGSLSVITEQKKKKIIEGEEIEVFEDDEVAPEQGIEINVSLPHKKVKELHSLSGGERSLTSIALLFAMSQVNPPPFLVLDETDAALDEANSRKYGDMLEKLSKRSQLIVVTHNRETMSRAGVLYGVTVGQDGSSRLLSVRFDEATVIAK